MRASRKTLRALVVLFIQLSSLAPIRPLFRGALKLIAELRDLPEMPVEEEGSETRI